MVSTEVLPAFLTKIKMLFIAITKSRIQSLLDKIIWRLVKKSCPAAAFLLAHDET